MGKMIENGMKKYYFTIKYGSHNLYTLKVVSATSEKEAYGKCEMEFKKLQIIPIITLNKVREWKDHYGTLENNEEKKTTNETKLHLTKKKKRKRFIVK
jgi:hypothetical protein